MFPLHSSQFRCGLLLGSWLGVIGFAAVLQGQEAAPEAPAANPGLQLFQEHVRSLLIHQCLECHGGQSVKGDFDLSTRDKLAESGYLGENAEESYLLALVEHRAEPHMPHKAPKLRPEQIRQLRAWLDAGAPYDRPLTDASQPVSKLTITERDRNFWSFRPLTTPAVPTLEQDSWSRTEIDRFIREKQQAIGLHPNPEADRRILIRRVYFDLIGVPPTFEEVTAFINDPDSQAYEKLVDRLLESPQFGERWARHWLDVARFGESHGYEQDYDRPHAYHYRDFVIRAINEDLPFDQFARWQIAGDELAPENPEALKATGFLCAGVFPTQLTEDEFESARYEELDDMLGTTGLAFLGLSIGCARCHDHKFDPIPVHDYYEMASAFTTAIRSELELELDPAANAQARAKHAEDVAGLQANLTARETSLREPFLQVLANPEAVTLRGRWELLTEPDLQAAEGSRYQLQPDGSWLAQGKAPAKETLTLRGQSLRRELRAIRIEALAHSSLPQQGPGRAGNGNFVLSHLEVAVERAAADGSASPTRVAVPLQNPRATHQQNTSSLSVAASIDADRNSGWAVDSGGIGHDQAAVFEFAEPLNLGPADRLIVILASQHPNPQHLLGRFRVSVTELPQAPAETGALGPASEVQLALQALRSAPATERTAQHSSWEKAWQWYLSTDASWQEQHARLQDLQQRGPDIQRTKVMITGEGVPKLPHHADGRGFPHFYPETHHLTRGDVRHKGDVAQLGFLQVLMRNGKTVADWRIEPPVGWTKTSFRRASFAHWLTDVEDGAGNLLARVAVNRLWQHHFGHGIVATPNDFGVSGAAPTHPELLEWLASDLVTHGWTLKRLHRQMLLSSVYRQSNAWDEQRATLDRENQLLWRRTPQRLEGEAIRDSLLAVSGQLDPRMYGPGTLDQDMPRRSIYFFVKRSQLIPMMMLFDWPESLVSIGQRPNTTVAPQALLFMNSPQGRRYAVQLANRVLQAVGESSEPVRQIEQLYRLAYGRNPQQRESELAVRFLLEQQQLYQSQNSPQPAQTALADLSQAVLSGNEFCYME